MIEHWSFSGLSTYEECPARAKFRYVDKIQAPQISSPALDRGNRVHDNAEAFVKGEAELCNEASKFFEKEFNELQKLYGAGKVKLERNVGFNRDWKFCEGWENAWCYVKMDAEVDLDELALVIDHKTGKRKYNEAKHSKQLWLYIITKFLERPELQCVQGELWYHDLGYTHVMNVERKQAMNMMTPFKRKAEAMCSATEFPAKPSQWNCRFCPYGPGRNKTGDCTVGIRFDT